ncbi:MAG: hypothetical protein GYB67_02425 [Chloroflexi bacterium]|nr:hypothetical protein [Chloroflexota bacterium]
MVSIKHIGRHISVLIVLLLSVAVVRAQDLDATAAPLYGSITLEPELPDPFIVTMLSGGSVEASTAGPGCTGFVSSAPDFVVTLDSEEDTNFLRIFFVGDGDASLVVQPPDSPAQCSADSFGTPQPAVSFEAPPPGDYAVWVGSPSAATLIPGYLLITEQSALNPADFSVPLLRVEARVDATVDAPAAPPRLVVDGAQPVDQALAAGFPDDPVALEARGGGPIDVGALDDLPDDCGGFTTAEPIYTLDWSGPAINLRLFFVADTADADDATLIVHTPDDVFVCNDDFEDANPLVDLPTPTAGTYRIWIGAAAADARAAGTLYITELSLTPALVEN